MDNTDIVPLNDAEIPTAKRNEIAACISIKSWLQLVHDAAQNKNVHAFRLACAIQKANATQTPDGASWPIWKVAARHFLRDRDGLKQYIAELKLAIDNLKALERSLKPKRPKKDQA
jgi:hypothetical protein